MKILTLLPTVLLCLCPMFTFAANPPAPVYRTGQTADLGGAYMDDGYYEAGAFFWQGPRFKDNGDGTVDDSLTGLIWAKEANTPTIGTCTGGAGKNWQEALNYVACLNTSNYHGHNDWILPNINELKSLVDLGHKSPALPAEHPFTGVYNVPYWSSSAGRNTQFEERWGVDMNIGTPTYNSSSTYELVWPVRVAKLPSSTLSLPRTSQVTSYANGDDGALKRGVVWPSPRFTDNSDGTITDNLTGLMWLKEANCYPSLLTWAQSFQQSANLTSGQCGLTAPYNDWRMPNREEMESLFDRLNNPSLPSGHPFTNVSFPPYWTSSSPDSINAWAAFPETASFGLQLKTNGFRFWSVRGGQISRTISVSRFGNGSGNVTADPGPLVWAGNWGTGIVNYGSSVTLTATANPGSKFDKWGGGCTVAGNVCTLNNVYYNWVTSSSSSAYAYFITDDTDTDGDGIRDYIDNCPSVPNPYQQDFNHNGIGDACEDSDNDGLTDAQEIANGTDPLNPDRTVPVASFSVVPLRYSNQTSGTIAFGTNETATFQCKVDSAYYTLCTSPFSYSNLAYGQHTFYIKAIDAAGNVSVPATHTWTVNTVLAASSAVLIPQTRQTKCYDSAGVELTSCDGTGQDGDKQAGVAQTDQLFTDSGTTITDKVYGMTWQKDAGLNGASIKTGIVGVPATRFTDNGNGTQTDNLTGLVWLKNAGCFDSVGGVAKGTYSGDSYLKWADALTWSNNLKNGACALSDGSVAGDWRLPNIDELASLLTNYSGTPATWLNDAAQGFTYVTESYYWSSNSFASNTGQAWTFNMNSFDLNSYSMGKSFDALVWPVRGGFVPQKVTVTKSGTGNVKIGTGFMTYGYVDITNWAGTTASILIAPGEKRTLIATPSTGLTTLWSGCDSSIDNYCYVTMNSTKNVTVTFVDVTAPAVPSNIETHSPTLSGQLVTTWTRPVDTDFNHIHIYRSAVAGTLGTLVADNVTGLKYTDTGLTSQTKYYYTVRSVDTTGSESTNIAQVFGTTLDVTPPAVPTNISANFTGPTPATTIAWNKPADTDFSHIHIYRSTVNGTLGPLLYDNISATNKTDTGLENGATYYYTIRAVDKLGNETTNTTQVSATVTLADVTGPGAVSNVTITFPANGDKTTLTWTNPGGDFALTRIYRSTISGQKGILVYQGTTATFTDTAINPGSTYWYTIDALDTAGNVSAYTAPSVTPVDAQVPGCIAQLKAAPLADAKIQLTWLRSPATDVNLYYDIYGDNGSGTMSTTSTTSTTHPVTTWTSDALTNGTTYQYAIKVADGTGNTSATCATVAATALTNPSAAGVSASIRIPYSGKKYGGNQLQIMAEQASGSVADLKSIQFEYYNTTSSQWQAIPVASTSNTINPDLASPFFIHWDVSALPPDEYKLRAVATNINNFADGTPGYITVNINNASAEVTQSAGNSQETVNSISGGTVSTTAASITIPAGTYAADTTVTITTPDPVTKAATVPINYDNGKSFHDITTTGTTTAESTVAVEIPYADVNDDLKLDTAPLISVLDLKICRNISGQTWTCLDSTVDTTTKVVRANTTSLGLFALLVPPVSLGQSGYNMASVALTPLNSATSAVFGGYVLDYNPASQTFFQPATILPGHGYFIWGARALKPKGTEITTATHTVAIKKGWNLIGNPYKMKLPVQSLTLNCGAPKSITQAELDGEIVGTFFYAINGAYELATTQTVTDTIDPWKGYWLLSDKDCDLIFTKP